MHELGLSQWGQRVFSRLWHHFSSSSACHSDGERELWAGTHTCPQRSVWLPYGFWCLCKTGSSLKSVPELQLWKHQHVFGLRTGRLPTDSQFGIDAEDCNRVQSPYGFLNGASCSSSGVRGAVKMGRITLVGLLVSVILPFAKL